MNRRNYLTVSGALFGSTMGVLDGVGIPTDTMTTRDNSDGSSDSSLNVDIISVNGGEPVYAGRLAIVKVSVSNQTDEYRREHIIVRPNRGHDLFSGELVVPPNEEIVFESSWKPSNSAAGHTVVMYVEGENSISESPISVLSPVNVVVKDKNVENIEVGDSIEFNVVVENVGYAPTGDELVVTHRVAGGVEHQAETDQTESTDDEFDDRVIHRESYNLPIDSENTQNVTYTPEITGNHVFTFIAPGFGKRSKTVSVS